MWCMLFTVTELNRPWLFGPIRKGVIEGDDARQKRARDDEADTAHVEELIDQELCGQLVLRLPRAS